MNPILYGLQVDFVTRNGHYMVLSAEGGLNKEQLSPFQVNMLLSNKIPHLLTLQIEERDNQMKLYYNITGKRMLTNWLRMGTISIRQFFSLLYAIVDIVGESNVYMLQEGRYVLKEDYIYCGVDLTDIHLTYVPKEVLAEKHTLSVDLQHLASRLVHKVSELSGSGYQELMSYLMDESFNIPVLKQLLQKHRSQLGNEVPHEGSRSDGSHTGTPHPVQSHSNTSTDSELGSKAARTSLPSPPLISKPPSSIAITDMSPVPPPPIHVPPVFSPSWFEEDDQQGLRDKNKKLQLPVILVGFLCLCLVWKLYLDHSNEGWLLVCSGLSLLVLDLIFIVLRIWKPGKKHDEAVSWDSVHKAISEERQQASGLQPFFTPKIEERQLDFVDALADHRNEATVGTRLDSRLNMNSLRQDSVVTKETDNYYSNLEQRTTLLAPTDATVCLSASSQQLARKALIPHFEWDLAGVSKKVRLERSPFVMGRSGSGVDFGLEEPGVSRIHAEITMENGQNMIKDLGSRNGTYINGEILVPYRMYSLQEGDIVKLISTEFVFKMGS